MQLDVGSRLDHTKLILDEVKDILVENLCSANNPEGCLDESIGDYFGPFENAVELIKAKLEKPSRKKAVRKQGVGKDAIKSKTIGSKEFKSLLDNMLVFTGSIDASKKQPGKNS